MLGGFSSWVWLQSTISEVTIKRLLIFTREFCLTTGIQIIMSFIFSYYLILLTYYCHEQTNHLLNEEKIIAVGTLTAVISVWSSAPASQRSGFSSNIWNPYIHNFKYWSGQSTLDLSYSCCKNYQTPTHMLIFTNNVVSEYIDEILHLTILWSHFIDLQRLPGSKCLCCSVLLQAGLLRCIPGE